ncbi:MAG: ABC transporter permease, partial [Salinigranum sp.]
MTGYARRIRAEAVAEGRSFLRRRTAVFFTFFFPVIIVGIFGLLIQTKPTGGGLFAKPQSYYVPGYLAVVVVLTPLSRVGSTVARHRSERRFEKLVTTPLSRAEWLVAHTLVNIGLIGVAGVILMAVLAVLGKAPTSMSPAAVVLFLVFLALGIAMFCAFGSIIGSIADSEDGVIAASNGLGIPLVFLA